ncbi:peptidase family M48-domain-containing protein [Desarmillaria ectypa]|nr:peptidase family M48-domain-containing protein [Desarmillaria ectypa]
MHGFHSTPRREGLPFYLLASVFKASTTLEIARTAGRIVLTFVPVILLKNHKSRKYLKFADIKGIPTSEEKKTQLLKRIRNRTILFHILLLIPASLFWLTIIASMERTPLTGRWRLIILSPEEEDDIAAQLAGPGWYKAVDDILAQDGPTRYIPPSDWRYEWVRNTLRSLEATLPILIQERELCPDWVDYGPHNQPLPPPAEYPLRPRPRASETLRRMCSAMCERTAPPVPHAVAGPPYSLLVVDKPEASNAFSYGFGPDGGGGIVVYSGFIDEILARSLCDSVTVPEPQSWWSLLLGRSSSSSHPIPSERQKTEMAILLAHELSHLILSHHLETLSSGTVIIPGTLSILSDVLRVFIFPFTMLFGPFVNDALAQLGRVGSGELVKVGDYCTSVAQEIEADVVSARLLAHAGYDVREAVSFWEERATSATECAHAESIDGATTKADSLARRIMGSSHPMNEMRVDRLKSELVRWETERRAALLKRAHGTQKSSIVLAAA